MIAVAILGVLDGLVFGYSVSTAMPEEGVGFSYAVQTPGYFASIWSLLTFLPSLAVTVRRLHDTGRSGWWILIMLVPLIGFILMIVWLVRRGDSGANQHGPDPLSGPGSGTYSSSIPRVPRR